MGAKEALVARIAFYIGILCLIAGLINRIFEGNILSINPASFLAVTQVWLIIALVALVFGIYRKMADKSEK